MQMFCAILNHMTLRSRLLVVILCCAVIAWLAGPPGRLLVVLLFMLVGPGYVIERLLLRTPPTTLWLRPTLWIGFSLSSVALLYQWTTLLGLALTPPLLAVLLILCMLAMGWIIWRDLHDDQSVAVPRVPLTTVALLGILALTLWTRFVQISDLVLPAWVDSVHHALLIRIVAETGQAPYSLRPYLPVDNLPYHWGYHVFTAAVMQLSGVTLPQVMLWQGQILNALHTLTCAALAAYLWRRPLAGVVAALIVGLISIMPAYYVSWGRYTQLMGLLLLPALTLTWHIALRNATWRWWIAVALLLAGLSIIHFRVIVFAGGLLAVLALVWAIDQPWQCIRARLGQATVTALLTGLLAAPWLALLVARTLLPAVEQPQSLAGGGSYNAVNLGLLWAGQNRWLIALALAGAAWGLARRSRVMAEQIGWVGALTVLANPWLVSYLLPAVGVMLALWAVQQRRLVLLVPGIALMALNPALVRLPYLWLITNDAVVISLFIPISVMIGGGVCLLADWLQQRQFRLPVALRPTASSALRIQAPPLRLRWLALRADYLLPPLLIGLALWGTWNLRSVINYPATVFTTPADVQAIDWIADHTPADARFLINAAPWLSTANRGVDGGWWLMPLTGRWTSTPPVLFTYGPPEYVAAVKSRTNLVRDFAAGQEDAIYQLIATEQISHIYLSHSGPLTPALFADSTRFERVYERGGGVIFLVR